MYSHRHSTCIQSDVFVSQFVTTRRVLEGCRDVGNVRLVIEKNEGRREGRDNNKHLNCDLEFPQ